MGVISWRKLAGQSRPATRTHRLERHSGCPAAPSDQPHSGTTRTTTAAGWGQTGGRRRLWPPRRGCQCPRFGHLRASGEAGRLHGAQRPHRAGVSARGLWSRTRVSFGTCTAGRQPRDSWIIHHKEVIASHDLQRSGMVRLARGGRLERWTAPSAAAFSVPRMSAASDTALTSGRASC